MSTEGLIDRGYKQLARGDFDSALTTGEKLIAKGEVEGYVIKACAMIAFDEEDAAIHLLEDGLVEFPDAWMLHYQLGGALTAAERFEEGILALRQAATYEDAEGAQIALSLAKIHLLQGDFDGVLEALAGNQDWDDLELDRIIMQLSALFALERWSDILAFTGAMLIEDGEDFLETYGEESAAHMFAVRAMALLKGKDQKRAALNLAWDVLRLIPDEKIALAVVREARGQRSPFSRLFALHCDVTAPNEEPFLGQYLVVADTLADAFNFVVEYEAQTTGGEPVLAEHSEAGPMADEPQGIIEVVDEEEDEEEEED